MIRHLSVCNYESHADTEIEFGPGVNVIVGLSDAGKSALFRAMCWCMFNRPTGDVFMRRGTGEARVTLGFDNGMSVIRERTKSRNAYYLGELGEEDEQVFTAFGHDVPDAVRAVINMDRTLNVAGQIDPIFLLQESPGEVARHFNDTAGLSDIDTSLSHLQGKERSTKRQAASLREREQELGAQLEQQYAGLDDAAGALSEAEVLAGEISKLDGRRRALAGTISAVHRHREQVQALSALTAHADKLEAAVEIQRGVDRDREALGRWRYAVRSCREAQARWTVLVEQVDRGGPVLDRAVRLAGKLEESRQDLNAWRDAVNRFRNAEEDVQEARERLGAIEAEWHEVAPDACPLCDGTGRLG